MQAPLFEAPEVLYYPGKLNKEWADQGLAKLVKKSIDKSPDELKETLRANIILTGGTSLLPGQPQRLLTELQIEDSACKGKAYSVLPVNDAKLAPWKGGAIVSRLDSFQASWVTK